MSFSLDTDRLGQYLLVRVPQFVRHLRWISLGVAIWHLIEGRPPNAAVAALMALALGPTSKWMQANVGPALRPIPWSAAVIAPTVTLLGTANGFGLGWSVFSFCFWALFLVTARLGKKAFSPPEPPPPSG